MKAKQTWRRCDHMKYFNRFAGAVVMLDSHDLRYLEPGGDRRQGTP